MSHNQETNHLPFSTQLLKLSPKRLQNPDVAENSFMSEKAYPQRDGNSGIKLYYNYNNIGY